ncbi:hypothetical protein ACQEVF_07160 [Nonomuraea polychroma]|uniref:hypothetical protein n=1 Tax=Nonomuraea polychroma TaxID=46176 RepID=UPI003D914B90
MVMSETIDGLRPGLAARLFATDDDVFIKAIPTCDSPCTSACDAAGLGRSTRTLTTKLTPHPAAITTSARRTARERPTAAAPTRAATRIAPATLPNATLSTCATAVGHGPRTDCTAPLTLVSAAVHTGVRAANPTTTPRTRSATEIGAWNLAVLDRMQAR